MAACSSIHKLNLPMRLNTFFQISMPKDAGLLVPGFSILIYIAACIFAFSFTTDDTYITFLHSKNLAEHFEIAPSLGNKIQGYTNFSFVIVNALLYLVTGPDYLEAVSKCLLIFIGSCGIFLLWRSQVLVGLSKLNPIPALLTATSTPFIIWTVGGLETILLAFFLILALYCFIRIQDSNFQRLFLFFGFLSFITRWDSLLFFVFPMLYLLIFQTQRARLVWDSLLYQLIPIGIYLNWVYHYYGELLPTSASKASLDFLNIHLDTGYFYSLLGINWNWICWCLCISIFTLLFLEKKNCKSTSALRLSAPFALAIIFYYLYVMSQGVVHMMFAFRFYTPMLPIMYFCAGIAFEIWARIGVNRLSILNQNLRSLDKPIIICSLFSLILLLPNILTFKKAYYENMLFTNDSHQDQVSVTNQNVNLLGWSTMHQRWKDAAKFFGKIIPSDANVYVWGAGIFPFFSDARFTDNILIGNSARYSNDYAIFPYGSTLPSQNDTYWLYPKTPAEKYSAYYPSHNNFILIKLPVAPKWPLVFGESVKSHWAYY